MSEASGGGFAKFIPGFEFLQNLATQAAGGVAQGLTQNIPQLPNLGHWVAPTLNVEDLEKRIEELKAVHFWLDQNARALGATIQALEVQKMTLATLKTMNLNLGDVANAFKFKPFDPSAAATAAPAPVAPEPAKAKGQGFAGLEIPPRTYGRPTETPSHEEEPEAEEPAASKPAARRKAEAPADPPAGVVDPMQWWGALNQQFQTIAANAMKDVAKQSALEATRQMATGLTDQAVKTAAGMAGKVTDTVARNVGTATGLGQAALRAVTGTETPAPSRRKTAAAPKAASKAAPKKAAPAAQATPAAKAPRKKSPPRPRQGG